MEEDLDSFPQTTKNKKIHMDRTNKNKIYDLHLQEKTGESCLRRSVV